MASQSPERSAGAQCSNCSAWRGCLGLEPSPEMYVEHVVEVFREVRRVLRDDGTLWLNLGDSYANDLKWGGSSGGKHAKALHGDSGIGRGRRTTGLKPKDLIGIPWRVALALQADGWWLRSDIIWHKPNPMPESVTDRPTRSHEYVFLLTKSERYFYDADAIAEPSVSEKPAGNGFRREARLTHSNPEGSRESDARWQLTPTRNARDVWIIQTQPVSEAHFATMPEELAERCILAGSKDGQTVGDPFAGSGTVGRVALKHRRAAVLCDLSPEYIEIQKRRTSDVQVELAGVG